MNTTIAIFSGGYIDLADPKPEDITLPDIAHALSNTARFNGHTDFFYSVAQHSVIASHIVPQELALYALLHDAAEAYLGDVASPLKQLLPTYKELEHKMEGAIAEHFGLEQEKFWHPHVKHADLVMLATEKRDLLTLPKEDVWPHIRTVKPLAEPIHPLNPAYSRYHFTERFEELTRT